MFRSRTPLVAAVLAAGAALTPSALAAQTPPKPHVTSLLTGFESLWHPSSTPLHGDVRDGEALAHNDEMVSWVNQHATATQRTRALQDAMYRTSDGARYDQSLTIADGLGRTLGDLYLEGRRSGKLPLTSALLDSSDGSAGDFVSTSKAKSHYSYPRPFLRARADDHGACRADHADASSLAANRSGRAWADGDGDLTVTRVAPQRDSSHRYVAKDVTLDPNYDGLCLSGSFPSGHTVTAYEAGTTLATLVPEVAPGVLARASEAANNRLVLGVHYPFDVIGGRMAAQSGIATLWADESFRTSTLEPARKELRDYLSAGCTKKLGVTTLAQCVAKDQPYRDDPYGGSIAPGGSSQQVSDRASALVVYRERLDYGFTPKSAAGQGDSATESASSSLSSPASATTSLAGADSSAATSPGASTSGVTRGESDRLTTADVPPAAAALLRTTYPTLTDDQRRAVLAQTAIPSGNPLAVGDGAAWQRLDLAAAMSQRVTVSSGGAVTVTSADRAEVAGPGAQQRSNESSQTSTTSGDTHSTSPWPALAPIAGLAAAAAVVVGVLLARRRPS